MLLLSIHPRFVDAILAGEKTVELRRQRPRIEDRSKALIYATSPRMELVGTFQIRSIVRRPLGPLWRSVNNVAQVTKAEFDAYFAGLENGVAIEIGKVHAFSNRISLDELRRAWGGFHPPQGFRYITPADFAKLSVGKAA